MSTLQSAVLDDADGHPSGATGTDEALANESTDPLSQAFLAVKERDLPRLQTFLDGKQVDPDARDGQVASHSFVVCFFDV